MANAEKFVKRVFVKRPLPRIKNFTFVALIMNVIIVTLAADEKVLFSILLRVARTTDRESPSL